MNPAIVIPVYNHGRQIGAVVQRALSLGFPVFVVDDGSTDETAAEIAAVDGVVVLRHPHNRGKGAALLTGFAAAAERGCDLAISMDGDGQKLVEDGNTLLAAVADGRRCLVVGVRQGMDRGTNVPWTSRFGRGFSNFWVAVCGGPRLADSQSGFRLYPLPETQQLGVRAQRYQFEVEVLVRARLAGIAVRETPVQVIYPEKGERVSHFRPWLDFLRNSETFSRLLWLRLIRMVFRL